jgi:hypothetical protein
MKQEADLIRARLKTPRAAAITGILFSVLLIAGLYYSGFRSEPIRSRRGAWLKTSSSTIALGLNLVPFAGIAFLWFIGVLRDRLREFEDRFFATVLDSASWLCVRAFSPAERALYWVDINVIPCLGVVGQHLHPD